VFLHYLAKETNIKIASFHSVSYDHFIRLSIDSFILLSKLPAAYV